MDRKKSFGGVSALVEKKRQLTATMGASVASLCYYAQEAASVDGPSAVTLGQEPNVSTVNMCTAMLGQVAHAMDRQASGQYGLCEDCNRRIPKARLRELPWATRCVHCQRNADPKDQHSARDAVFARLGKKGKL